MNTIERVFAALPSSKHWTPLAEPAGSYTWQPIPSIERFVAQQFITVLTNDDKAAPPSYDIRGHYIMMPPRHCYREAKHYYQNLFHELAHSTMHKLRDPLSIALARVYRAFRESYQIEEATVELAANLLMHHFGIADESSDEISATYIADWLRSVLPTPLSALHVAIFQADDAATLLLRQIGQ